MSSAVKFYLPSLLGTLLIVLFTGFLVQHERLAAFEDFHRLFSAQLEAGSLLLQQENGEQLLERYNRAEHGRLTVHEREPVNVAKADGMPLVSLFDAQGQATYGLSVPLADGRWLLVEEDQRTLLATHGPARWVIWALGLSAGLALLVLTILARYSRAQLLAREALYRQILDHLPVQVRVRDPQGGFVLQNATAAQWRGTTYNNLPLNIDNPALDANAFEAWAGLRDVLGSGKTQERYYTKGHYVSPTYESYRLVAFPIYGPDDELEALGTVVVDETRLSASREALRYLSADLESQVAQRTEELASARDAAEAATRAKADFLANMSHEIRSPLNAVIGLAHLAARANRDDKVQAYLEKILKSAGHLQVVVNGILDYSKISAGKMHLERVAFCPEQLLEGLADMYWERAQAKALALVLDIDPRLPAELYGDPLRIAQILYNFTDNAIKFTAEGVVSVRVLLLDCQQGRWSLRFEVQDSGIGIDASQLNQMFEAFEQAPQAARQGGTGLGLSICRQLAELMGGHLNVRSEPGQGSLFSLDLTLAGCESVAPDAAPVSDSRRVLLAERDSHRRTSTSAMLATLGLHVTQADSAASMLALLEHAVSEQRPFAMLFIDWDLAEGGASELAQQIQQHALAPDSQRVLLCARGSSTQLPQSLLEWFDAVIDQPVVPQRLREVVLRLQRDEVPVGLAGKHVLLVENESLNQEVGRELLEALQVRVSLAGDGQQALQILAQDSSIDLVLMDVEMPVLNGLDATRRIRVDGAQLPVIAMTGNSLPGDRERCLAAGMNDYLSKPIMPCELAQTLSRWLKQSPPKLVLPAAAPPAALHIDGLEVEVALERLMGNQALYLKLLKRFVADYSDVDQPLYAAIVAGQWQSAAEQAHSFKSLAATLGASHLQALTIALEQALSEQQGLELWQQFSTELHRLQTAITQALNGH